MDEANDFAFGNIILFACACLTAICSLLQKPLLRAGYKPSVVTGLAYLFAMSALLVTSLVSLALTRDISMWMLKGGAMGWIAVVYAGVIGSAIDYNLSSYANQHLDATIISAYSVLQPVLAMAWGYFSHTGENLQWHDLAGVVLILMGLPLVARANQSGGEPSKEEASKSLLANDDYRRLEEDEAPRTAPIV